MVKGSEGTGGYFSDTTCTPEPNAEDASPTKAGKGVSPPKEAPKSPGGKKGKKGKGKKTKGDKSPKSPGKKGKKGKGKKKKKSKMPEITPEMKKKLDAIKAVFNKKACAMALALHKNSTLWHVDLSSNEFDKYALKMIVKGLKQNNSIMSVHLADNKGLIYLKQANAVQ
jgi:hypothetical protein